MTPVERLKLLQLKWHHTQDAALCLFQRVLEWGHWSSSDGSEELSVAGDAETYGPSFSEVFDWIDRLIVFLIGWIDAFDRQTRLVSFKIK